MVRNRVPESLCLCRSKHCYTVLQFQNDSIYSNADRTLSPISLQPDLRVHTINPSNLPVFTVPVSNLVVHPSELQELQQDHSQRRPSLQTLNLLSNQRFADSQHNLLSPDSIAAANAQSSQNLEDLPQLQPSRLPSSQDRVVFNNLSPHHSFHQDNHTHGNNSFSDTNHNDNKSRMEIIPNPLKTKPDEQKMFLEDFVEIYTIFKCRQCSFTCSYRGLYFKD